MNPCAVWPLVTLPEWSGGSWPRAAPWVHTLQEVGSRGVGYDGWRKSGPPCGEYPLLREGRLMPRRLSTTSGVRQRLIDTMQASWDRWRIEGRMCELERALKAGESVVPVRE
jgi:hypothetical protein